MNAILAAILSFIIPGLGQALSGEVKKGVIFFIGGIILLAILGLIFRHWVLYIIDLIYCLYVAFDAYNMNQ